MNLQWQKNWIFDWDLNEKFAAPENVKKIKLTKSGKINEILGKVICRAPENIQISGSALHFNGLPFAKFSSTKIWFGVENKFRQLNENNVDELNKLIEDLLLYRSHDSPNKRHIFYKLFPEAWLEAKLAQDISKLDGNLILSPVHNQFRASAEQIDLLALRKDGRLVVIEIKVSPNKEHLFQALGYWQEIELQRKTGNLKGLFGKLPIANLPAVVYLAAPHSCFHHDLHFLAKTVLRDLEIFRFDLKEHWRHEINVIEKSLVNG